jgi:hypothetical protein
MRFGSAFEKFGSPGPGSKEYWIEGILDRGNKEDAEKRGLRGNFGEAQTISERV